MRRDIFKVLSAAAIGVGLFGLYLTFLGRYLVVGDLSNLSEIETIILVTLLLRAIVLSVLGTKFTLQPIVPIIVFSLEALLIPPLLVLIIVTGDQGFANLMGVILTAWFGASALILTPYTIYGFAKGMVRETSLVSVVVVGTLELVSVVFLSDLLTSTSTTVSGLTGLGTLIISNIRADLYPSGLPNPVGDLSASAGLVLFFVGMICYFSLGPHGPGAKIKTPFVVALMLTATLLVFIFTAAVTQLVQNLLLVLTAPAAALFFIIWGTARGRN